MLIKRDPARDPAKYIDLISQSGISRAAGGSQVHSGITTEISDTVGKDEDYAWIAEWMVK